MVSGEITPDNFVMDKVILEMASSIISKKHHELKADVKNKCVVKLEVDDERANAPCMNQEELKAITQISKKLEKLHKCPQDIEWAIDADLPDGKNIALLQSRPETVWSQKKEENKSNSYSFGMEGIVDTLLNPLSGKKS